jgi:formylmethanofuran dehydrogenase subunit E
MSHTYLDIIREHNKAKMSKCEKCGAKSETIDADGARVLPVCKRCYELAHEA